MKTLLKERKNKMNKITVKNIDINITGIGDDDYISLTDLARLLNNNPDFKPADFGGFKSKPGKNAFIISPFESILFFPSI